MPNTLTWTGGESAITKTFTTAANWGGTAPGNDDTLIINTENGQIYIETPANASSYTPNKITGAFWPLEPGNNTVVMTVTWGSGSDSDMTIKWYEQHHHMGDLG